MINEIDRLYLLASLEAARKAREAGNYPFGAVLVSPDGNLLLESGNTVNTHRDCTAHAETNLVRLASQRYECSYLARCTLYSSTEPCAMCAGAIYWSGIGRVVYALSVYGLRVVTGENLENLTLDLPCREVFASGHRPVEVEGPFLEDLAKEVHVGYWKVNQ
ncbi:MAG TPA: nucleoside deaminase [Anaerolineaceae bacterium]